MTASAYMQEASGTKPKKRSARSSFLLWLRRIHLYLGLWGAVLGLLFGFTGILLNHRVVMKIPVEKAIQHSVELQLPQRTFNDPEELAEWLDRELKLKGSQAPFIKVEPARQVIWLGNEVTQPERWIIDFHRPGKAVKAEHYPGSPIVKLDHSDSTIWGTLTRLHMGVGVSAIWILLADSIAGSLILLSLSGLLLWTQMHKVRLIGLGISITAFVSAILLAISMG